MKKTSLLLALLVYLLGYQVNAQITAYPYSEDFEAGDGGWTVDNGAAGTWALGTPANAIINSADSGTNAWVTNLTGNYNNSEAGTITSPVFDFTALNAPSIEFGIWWNSEFSWDGLVLQSSIDAGTSWQNVGAVGDPNNWFTDGTIGGNPGGQQEGWTGRNGTDSGGWVVARHALVGLNGQSSVLLRFAFGSDTSVVDEGVAFDTISIFEVSCPEPLNFAATTTGDSTADITWAPGGTESDWEIVIQPAGTGVPTGAGTATMTNAPYPATALMPSTAYEAYVRADCGTTDGFSTWVGPVTFTTFNVPPPPPVGVTCASGTSTLLFTEDFGTDANTDPAGWTGTGFAGTNGNWDITGPAANSGGTGPANTYDGTPGGMHLEYESSGNSAVIASAISPAIDLSTATDGAELAFFMHAFGADMGTLNVNVGTSATGPFTTAYTWVGDYQAADTEAWVPIGINLDAYLGQVIYIEFSYGGAGTGFTGDMSIDQITVETCGNFCVAPTGIVIDTITDTTANVSWTANNAETAWEIVIQPAGTGAPTGAGTAITTNPYALTSLTAITDYELYILADCGGSQSVWAGPINFSTLNTPPPPPVGVTCASGSSSILFTEDFGTDANTDPTGWTGTGFAGTNGNWDITGPGANSGGTGPANTYDGTPGGMHLEYESSGNSSVIASAISPAIDLTTAVDGAELAFFMHAFGSDFGTLNVNIGTSATGPFTTAYTWVGDYQTTDVEAWVPIGINLDAYLGQVIYLEFSYGGAGTGFTGDMSIDQITVETCGNFCIAPSGITVSNVTGTTADITWTANSGETAWEYIIQPAGTGTPTGPGTMTTSTIVNATGLSFTTDYEVYVLADCGGLQSVWAGPVNFSTVVQTNFVVDCAVGPVNFTYCYENNDTNVFTFVSTDGTPLNFVINAGEVENNWDELVVTDIATGTDLNAGTPYGNAGNVAGISYQSTGDSISFNVTADGIFDCGSEGFTPLDITVSCATCINPAASYIVIDDCANGDQFLVDVDITSLGDATSLLITDNQGSTGVSVNATGVTQFGPYPFLTDIVFTVSNEQDVNCVIMSPAIQLAACPPDNDNCINATLAVVNADETCTSVTPGTILEATDSGVPTGSCGGNPDDDVWFEFTALDEVEVISILNITGGTPNLDFALYEGSCNALVELLCVDGTASVTPLLVVGNTYYVRVFSGGSASETSTFDLCIQKAPAGTICENAGSFCDNNGTQSTNNVTGFPSSGQVACLFSTPNPSWNVIQIGQPGIIEIEINQVNAGGGGLDVDFVLWGPFDAATDFCAAGVLDQGCPTPGDCPNNTTSPNFYPSGNIIDCSYSAASVENITIDNALASEVYILLVTNFSGQPGDIQIQQTNSGNGNAGSTVAELEAEIESVDAVFVDVDNDDTTPSIANLCGFSETTLVTNSPFADTFEWYQNGIFIATATTGSLLVNESDSYTVIAYDAECDVTAQNTVIINFFQEATANIADNIVTCDDETADGIEDFDLDAQTAAILGTQSATDFVVTYHATLSDAQSGVNPLTSPYDASSGTVIYVRVEDVDAVGSGSGCASTNTTFSLTISGPLPTATSVDMELCDDVSRDETEEFDLDSNTSAILNGQDPATFVVTYYETEVDALAGMNALPSLYNNTSNPQTIYARVENITATDCFKTTPFDLIVNEVPDTTFAMLVAYEVCPNATIPITITAVGNNYTASEVTIAWYNEGVLISGQTSLALPTVLTTGDYTIEVTFNDTGCALSETVFIDELETCVIPQGISPNGDGLNDTFDLSSYDVQSLEIFNRNGAKVYEKTNYLDEWHGQSKDGDELPVGTYYYVMKYQGDQVKAAWVYINK